MNSAKLTTTQLKQAFEFLPKSPKHGDIVRVPILPVPELNMKPILELELTYNELQGDWQLENYILFYL
jgi:hypothetical protein